MPSNRYIPMIGLLALSVGAAAQTPGALHAPQAPAVFNEPNWKALCAAAVARPLPPPAAALAAHAPSPKRDCDEQALYYGLGQPPDYQAALQCAYQHRAYPENTAGSFVQGAGTLAMLYANGDGVARDYALATRFVCELKQSADAETEGRVARLEALADRRLVARVPFDLCDDATSGAMGGYCSDLFEKRADAARAQRIAAVTKKLPAPARAMLPALEGAEQAFEQARIRGEFMGGGGSGSTGFALDDQNKLREQFAINLERFAVGRAPQAVPAYRKQAEQALAAAYTAAGEFLDNSNAAPGEATAAGVVQTEQAWQGLFAAWMRFVPAAFPMLSPDRAATELLRLRTAQLKHLAR